MPKNSIKLLPRILKFNGEMLVGRPLAWSFPNGREQTEDHYNAVTEAYMRYLMDSTTEQGVVGALTVFIVETPFSGGSVCLQGQKPH